MIRFEKFDIALFFVNMQKHMYSNLSPAAVAQLGTDLKYFKNHCSADMGIFALAKH